MQGLGLGLAPIGHTVTVVGVTATTINISIEIAFKTGWVWEDIREHVEQVIDGYFLELAKSWEREDALIVRISQIESRLLEIPSIVDVRDTRINGAEDNLTLDSDSIPVRGDIIATTIT